MSEEKFPELSVEMRGSSGIEIRAPLSKNYDCVEFTLKGPPYPQPIFISPWMQFEPVQMRDERHRLAIEIARRATLHDTLVAQIADLQKQLEWARDATEDKQEIIDTAFKAWREERVKLGLPEDFSDVKQWPPQLMGGWRRQR